MLNTCLKKCTSRDEHVPKDITLDSKIIIVCTRLSGYSKFYIVVFCYFLLFVVVLCRTKSVGSDGKGSPVQSEGPSTKAQEPFDSKLKDKTSGCYVCLHFPEAFVYLYQVRMHPILAPYSLFLLFLFCDLLQMSSSSVLWSPFVAWLIPSLNMN